VLPSRVLFLIASLGTVACQGKSQLDTPRPPRPVVEARAAGSTVARVVGGHPCRAEIEGNELLVGTEPLVAQVGNTRWSGDDGADGTTLRRDGTPLVRLHDSATGIVIDDPAGATLLKVGIDGTVANARGEILRRAEASKASGASAIKIGDALITGTSDLALGVLVTAPELIPEVRALAACHRLSTQVSAPGK
jgi:hypothetical protein